jgi:hypothetical protein
MSTSEKTIPELVRAAEALESELVKLETLSRTIRKIRLDSEKNITRAAKQLGEVTELPDQLTARLGTLAAAMQAMQARQQAALEPLAVFAQELQLRMRKLGEHMQAFAALGEAAGEVTTLLQNEKERPTVLAHVKVELGKLAEGAKALFEAARADDFPDVARQAEALKQRVSSLRQKLDPSN